MQLENIRESDYNEIIHQLNDWWGGRNMVDMLPRLFFKNFNNTSFVYKENNEILGFLIGFISQTNQSKAYIHFIGVNPKSRNKQIGRTLYNSFFQTVQTLGAKEAECVTSPMNETSIRFHTKIGFKIVNGDTVNDSGTSYFKNYDGQGEDRVVFKIQLN